MFSRVSTITSLTRTVQNFKLMSIGDSNCVAHAQVIDYAKADKELIPFSRRQADLESVGEHVPVLDTASHGSQLSINPTSAPNGQASPISGLLEELLIMIFDDVITSESSSWKFLCKRTASGWRPLSPPRNLASVSRAWRTIVFACPMLWRRVILTPDQPIRSLREHLANSSPFPIHLTVQQWPFRNPIPASEPYSIIALTFQLQSILSPMNKDGVTLAPACHRVESITIHATESSTFLKFVLQTWTGRAYKFPALRRIMMDGNVCATWSRACFFDGKNAPALEHLKLSNVVMAHNPCRPPSGTRLNLTTLVWAAPVRKHGTLVVSVPRFHNIVSSFPNLTALELCGHVVGLEVTSVESLKGSDVAPLGQIRELRLSGPVFASPSAAFVLFYLVPEVRRLVVRGRTCTGPIARRTVMHALQAMIGPPKMFEWPVVLSEVDDLELDCVDGRECAAWKTWCVGELERWRGWRETIANVNVARVRVYMIVDVEETDMDEVCDTIV